MRHKTLGFTLLEVIAALAITSITALSVMSVASNARQKSQRFANQQLAYYVLSNQVIRAKIDPQTVSAGTANISEQGVDWTVVTQVNPVKSKKAKEVTIDIKQADSNNIIASNTIWLGD